MNVEIGKEYFRIVKNYEKGGSDRIVKDRVIEISKITKTVYDGINEDKKTQYMYLFDGHDNLIETELFKSVEDAAEKIKQNAIHDYYYPF
jgi:hypothetical protein